MLYPNISDSPFFKDVNVGKFLKKFENIYNNYQIAVSEKICRLFWYCKMFITCYVRFVISFLELNWTIIYINLKKKYKNRDIA